MSLGLLVVDENGVVSESQTSAAGPLLLLHNLARLGDYSLGLLSMVANLSPVTHTVASSSLGRTKFGAIAAPD